MEGMQTETYYLGTEDRILAYIPNCVKDSADGTVPLVLNLHWTSGTPEEQVSENGWLILVQDGIHLARKPHAQLAWDFMLLHYQNITIKQ